MEQRAEIVPQPMEDPMLEQEDARKKAATLWEGHAGKEPGRTCGPMETVACSGAEVWAGLVILWGWWIPKHFVTGGLQSVQGIHNGAVHEEVTLKKFVEKSPVGETPCWIRGREWGGRSGREKMWWTKHNPIPHPPYAIWDEVVKIVSELKPGKKGGVEERWFQYLGLFLINLFWSDG